jgi:hypothetical protein
VTDPVVPLLSKTISGIKSPVRTGWVLNRLTGRKGISGQGPDPVRLYAQRIDIPAVQRIISILQPEGLQRPGIKSVSVNSKRPSAESGVG